mgnify:CR=1 FL=1
MKVLSLFDGMSCGRIALDQLGIPVEKYYASEIDKYAIQVSQANYPDIIQIGDVTKVNPKDYMDVDLILAGSPCTGFSFAGKQLAFEDPQSKLFFDFIRILKAIKPKYFLLENVRMKKEFLEVITEQVSSCYTADDVAPEFKDMFGNVQFEPHFINAALVSAQSRQRYYWTNIPGIKQPEDRGIVLRDILETEPDNFTTMSNKFVKRNGDKNCMIDQNKEKASNLSAMEYVKNGRQGDYLACDQSGKPTNKPIKVGMNVEEVKVRKHEVDTKNLQHALRVYKTASKKTLKQIAEETKMPLTKVEHWFRTDSSFAIPGEDVWFKLKEVLDMTIDTFDKQIMEFEYRDGVFESTQRVYSDQGKSPTLTATNKEQMIETRPKQVGKIKDGGQGNRIYSQDGKSSTLSAQSGGTAGNGNTLIETRPKQVGVAVDIKGHDQIKRVYSPEGKSPTVTTCSGGHREPKVAQENLTWRKLTPLECERLQTVPDNYTNHVSNTRRYQMLGNGWCVEVIKHIFKNMEVE